LGWKKMKKPENQAINGRLVFFERVMVGKTGCNRSMSNRKIIELLICRPWIKWLFCNSNAFQPPFSPDQEHPFFVIDDWYASSGRLWPG
jgi:hypothetical protein